MKLRYFLLILAVAYLTLVGCSDASLYKGQFSDNSTAQVNFCTTPSSSVITKVKYLFVIDQSVSNKQNTVWNAVPSASSTPFNDPLGGSDPYGQIRYPSLINFLNNATQPNTYFAGLFFNTLPIVPFSSYLGGGPNEDTLQQSIWYTDKGGSDVVNSSAYMAAQYQNILCANGVCSTPTVPQADGGYADYTDTLALVNTSITQDLAYEQALVAEGNPLTASSYVIFWVSSAYPYAPGITQSPAILVNQVSAIMALKSQQQYAPYINSIVFNTGFYTTNSSYWSQEQTQSTLQEMAQAGQGSFIDFSTGAIDYSKFNVPQADVPFVLRDFWIQDASAVWWNGQLMLDTDNDGIPDEIELKWGSNPNAYDSDQNGLGDGIEYSLFGSPCGSINSSTLGQAGQTCTTAGAIKSFLAVPNCGNPGTYPNVYPDTDLDNLNDCEEGMLGSSHLDFDSNQDWVPDQLEWLYNIPFLYGTNGLADDPTNDGVDNYEKLKELFPINIPISQIHGIAPLSYTITENDSTAGQSCYTVNVESIATMSPNDVIRIYVMESQGPVGTLRHMRVLKNITRLTGSNLVINDEDLTP